MSEETFPGTEPMPDVPGCSQVTDIGQFLGAVRAAIAPRLDEESAMWAEHGPAATAAFEATGATLDSLGGNCPVQAAGEIDGMRFYFRARGDEWQFHVASSDAAIFNAPAFYIDREYGDWPDAGWMPRHEALSLITASIAEYRASVDTRPEGGDGTAPFTSGAAPEADAQIPNDYNAQSPLPAPPDNQ